MTTIKYSSEGNVPGVGIIESLIIQPDIRRKRVTVQVETSCPGTIRMSIDGTDCSTEGEPGTTILDFPDHLLWSPSEPHLYMLRCEFLVDGEAGVEMVQRFGMRELTIKECRFCLNNRPTVLKGIAYSPPADVGREAMAKHLALCKEAGFNIMKIGAGESASDCLELADELGVMAYFDVTVRGNPETAGDESVEEIRKWVRSESRHPSLTIWGLQCEPEESGDDFTDAWCRFVRELDPSRVVVAVPSGWDAARVPAKVSKPYYSEPEPIDALRLFHSAPAVRDQELYLSHNGTPDRLCVISEFGFGGLGVLGGDSEAVSAFQKEFADRGLDRVFGDPEGFAKAARRVQAEAASIQLDALRSNGKVSAYFYWQLCDTPDGVGTGIIGGSGNKRPVATGLAKWQAALRPLIQAARTNVSPREELHLTVTQANEERLEGRADLSLQVIGPTNQVLWKKKRNIKIPRHGRELWTGTIAASGSTGDHKFAVRLMQGMKRLTESTVKFHVFEAVEPCDVPINVLDPVNEWLGRCKHLARVENVLAPIHVVPPLGNSIRAYPENELAQALAQTREGAVTVFFDPPDDWNDFAEELDRAPTATSRSIATGGVGVFHYAKLHPVFDKLPSRCLFRQEYRNVAPLKTFAEKSDEDICGSFDARGLGDSDEGGWGSNILVRSYGSGRIVFVHLRIIEHLGSDPIADRMFVNLLRHFVRRSVPPEAPVAPEKKTVEWLRKGRTIEARKWMVIGMFPNWNESGSTTEYPPEREIDLSATYPGWYRAISWRPWFSTLREGHLVDLQRAVGFPSENGMAYDYGTAYAYAEFGCDRREEVDMRLGIQDPTVVYLNGRSVFQSTEHVPSAEMKQEVVSVNLRQGKNTILVKVSKVPGPLRFSLDFSPHGEIPMQLAWWR